MPTDSSPRKERLPRSQAQATIADIPQRQCLASMYIYQADWQYLTSVEFRVARARLERHAVHGNIRLLVSSAHLVEPCGLKLGYGARLKLLAEFPGVHIIESPPDQVMRQAARALASLAHDVVLDQPPLAITQWTEAQLLEACSEYRPVRSAMELRAGLGNDAHQLVGPTSKKDRWRSAGMIAALAKGDVDVFFRIATGNSLHPQRTSARTRIIFKLTSVLARVPALKQRLTAFGSPTDEAFRESVLVYLPASDTRRPN